MMDMYEGAYEKLKDVDTKRENTDLDDFEEFMRKVEEVNKMVHALTSNNKKEIEEASKNAAVWLKNQKKNNNNRGDRDFTEEIINEPCGTPSSKKNINKTIINDKLPSADEDKPQDLDHLNCDQMSQEAFMKSVEADAKKRSEDRKQRKKESDIIKMVASKAFMSKDYEKALDLYNKAIEIRKDSYVLYNNRALTLLHLGLNSRALKDCETALTLDEKNFKAALFKGKALFKMGEYEKSKNWMKEVYEIFPERTREIKEYEESWDEESENEN